MTLHHLFPPRRLVALVLFAALLGATPVLAQSQEELKQTYTAAAKAYKQGDFAAAVSNLKQAHQMALDLEEEKAAGQIMTRLIAAYQKWGTQEISEGDYEGAIVHLDAAIEMAPDNPRPYYNKALAQLKAGNREAGLATMNEAIEVAEAGGDRRVERIARERIRDEFVSEASQAMQEKRAAAALDALDAMTEYVEMDASAYYYQGLAYFEQGNYQQAIAAIEQGLQMHRGSKSEEARFHLVKGEAQLRLGNTSSACQSFRAATFGETKPRAEYHIENDCSAR
jgi:tetratricopeptide (TPR) repeat protein